MSLSHISGHDAHKSEAPALHAGEIHYTVGCNIKSPVILRHKGLTTPLSPTHSDDSIMSKDI